MSEKFVNTRPMPNKRRFQGWLAGIGCALVLVFISMCGSFVLKVYQFTPEAERAKLLQITLMGNTFDLTPSTWDFLAMIVVIVVGFFLGREIVRWLYRE